MKVLKWLVIAIGLFALLLGLAYGWGATLPREHTARVTETLPASPAQVYAALTDHEGSVVWRSDLSAVELLPDEAGHKRWREDSEWGLMTYEEVEAIPPRRYAARVADTSQGFGGTWTYEIEPDGDGTRLTITEDGFVDDPLFRLLSAKVFGHDATMRQILAALSAHLATLDLGQPVR